MLNKILDILRKEQIIILQYNGNKKIFISKKGGLYYINHKKEGLEKKETLLNNGYTNFNGLVAYITNILDNLGNINLEQIEDCKFVIK